MNTNNMCSMLKCLLNIQKPLLDGWALFNRFHSHHHPKIVPTAPLSTLSTFNSKLAPNYKMVTPCNLCTT